MIRKMMFVLALLLSGAFTATASAQDFQGFQAMSFPRSEVLVGARFLQDIGTSGPGAAPSNLTESRGLSSAVLTSQTRASILSNLGSYLGLSGSLITSRNASFNNLSLVSVMDLAALANVSAGEMFLSQAIKAGTISIRTNTATAAEIQARAEARSIPVNVTVTGANTRSVELDGRDLFVAYQVVQLTGGVARSYRALHDDNRQSVTMNGIWRVDLSNLDTRWETNTATGFRRPVTQGRIEVTNLRAPVGETLYRETFEFEPSVRGAMVLSLKPFRQGRSITAAQLEVAYQPEFRPLTDQLYRTDFPPETNYIRLITSTFEVRPVRNPRGL